MGIDKRQLLKNLIYLDLKYDYKTDEFISSYYDVHACSVTLFG